MDFFLTSKSLKQIKESGISDDFEIKILDKTIECSTFVAIFISKRISKEYRIDPTINQFTIQFPTQSIFYSNHDELKNILERTNFIEKFNQFLNGEPIHIDKPQNKEESDICKILFEIGKQLDNDEMIETSIENLGYKETINEANAQKCVKILQHLRQIGYSNLSENIIDIISSNFYTLFNNENEDNESTFSELKEMNRNDLELIFSSEKLQIESEDWLFEIINKLGPDFFFLYDYIEIQYLSIENVSRLIENINQYEIQLHGLLWSSICRRLILDVSSSIKTKNPRSIQINLNYIECNDGILKYLQKSSNDNVFVSKTIDVEVSGISNGEVKNIFDRSKDTVLKIKGTNNSFIVLDFKDKKVNLNKYYFAVPSRSTNYSLNRPKTWLIEGSNNKEKWELIDERENDSSLTDYSASKIFSINQNKNEFYRFIRIKENLKDSNDHRLLLSEIELYGNITKA